MLTISEKETEIIKYLKREHYTYIKLDNEDIVDVYNGIFNNIFNDDANGMIKNYYGLYYRRIKDYDNMMKYYLMAIELGCKYSMNNLGYWYESIGDYNNMIKYFLMAIDLNDQYAMSNLGDYYRIIGDYDNMIKYFTMAITLNNSMAMTNLAIYYENMKDYDNMIRYYLMAINLENKVAMNNLGHYYQHIKGYDNMMKYYLMAIELGSGISANNLGDYYLDIEDYDNMIKYYSMAIKLGTKLPIKQMLCDDREYSYYKIKFVVALFNDNKEIFDNEQYIGGILFAIEQHINSDSITDEILKIIAYIDIKYFNKCSKLLLLSKKLLMEKIELIDLHFNYSPDSKGYLESKNDFIERLV